MNTIITLANALATAAHAEIKRLDIQYNDITGIESIFDIHENGTITLPH